MVLTHVYFSTLHQSLSDVLATRDKTSDGARHVVLLQDARDDLGDRDGAQRGAGRGLPNRRVARCHRDREIPAKASARAGGGGAAFVEFRFILRNAGKKSVKFTSHIQQRES